MDDWAGYLEGGHRPEASPQSSGGVAAEGGHCVVPTNGSRDLPILLMLRLESGSIAHCSDRLHLEANEGLAAPSSSLRIAAFEGVGTFPELANGRPLGAGQLPGFRA